jgi:hypothetical protein
MYYHNKFTVITSQIFDGSTALTVFSSIDQAKNFFYTTDALSCSDNYSSRVEYQLVADENGYNTKLKRTEGFDTSGIGDQYNEIKNDLLNAGNWGNNPYTTTESADHLF